MFRIVDSWNSLPADALEARSMSGFRTIVHDYLRDKLKDGLP